jgi:ABC-type transport system involved in multi-copper enzyme maturation permease subunit
MLKPYVISVWRAGLRSRGIQAALILGLILIAVAYLSASFSPRQPQTVALDTGFSALRISLILLALVWIQELVAKEIDKRTVLFSLTYPVSRSTYVLGRYLGILGLLALATALLAMLLWLVVLNAGGSYEQGFPVSLGTPFWLTVFGLWVDAAVVTAFALLLASLSTVPMLPLMLGAAFAVGGKSLGAVMEYLTQGADGDKEVLRLTPVIDFIGKILPDLSRLDWRAWPMYGVAPETVALVLALTVAASYAALLLSLAIISFSRREFA